MYKYLVTVDVAACQDIEIEASSIKDARERVACGEGLAIESVQVGEYINTDDVVKAWPIQLILNKKDTKCILYQ